jgi:hypothetical protein
MAAGEFGRLNEEVDQPAALIKPISFCPESELVQGVKLGCC